MMKPQNLSLLKLGNRLGNTITEHTANLEATLSLQSHGLDNYRKLTLSCFYFSVRGNDIWGWTDPQTGKEYAIIGLSGGTSFVDVSDPESPKVLAFLRTR